MTFLQDSDFDYKIRAEIKSILNDGNGLETAIAVAISTIKMYIGGRYNLSFLDNAPPDPDTRNKFFVDMVIAIGLYKLYGQVGIRDLPTHRVNDYDDAITWLKAAGKGDIPVSGLETLLSDENPGEFILSSRKPTNWKT